MPSQHSSLASALLLSIALLSSTTAQSTSPHPRRGLAYVTTTHSQDDSIWDSSTSDLTWYYNYAFNPISAYANSKLEYVPMLWGAPQNPATDTTFLDAVNSMVASGTNITAILFLNEPDGTTATGGSQVDPGTAATIWKTQVEPLKKKYNGKISLGGPAVTGAPSGFNWLQTFFTECAGNCSVDFLPVHWYGNFEGLASHLGQVMGTYPNMTTWVTEFADAGASLTDSETFYNQSSSYLDRLGNVTRYSYFGAFRSDVSNVGPNAAFLTQDGKLTDIGSMYLGQGATGNTPKGAAGRYTAFAGSSMMFVLVLFLVMG
ncbi:hypothetical protein MMC25_004490 [Agyrium rufum]|nr:hypothetical protein [Agyrium rufum]